jgi:hypothetical protein
MSKCVLMIHKFCGLKLINKCHLGRQYIPNKNHKYLVLETDNYNKIVSTFMWDNLL